MKIYVLVIGPKWDLEDVKAIGAFKTFREALRCFKQQPVPETEVTDLMILEVELES